MKPHALRSRTRAHRRKRTLAEEVTEESIDMNYVSEKDLSSDEKTKKTTRRRKRSLEQETTEESTKMNYGSENDSSSDEENEISKPNISKADRILFDDSEDEASVSAQTVASYEWLPSRVKPTQPVSAQLTSASLLTQHTLPTAHIPPVPPSPPTASAQLLKRPRKQEATEETIDMNYGSENDSSSDEENEILKPNIPKGDRIFFDDPEDEASVSAQTVASYQWPLLPPPSPAKPTQLTPASSLTQHTLPVALSPPVPLSLPSASAQLTPPIPLVPPTSIQQSTSDFEPRSKWSFDWKQFPQPPISPLLRRESFLIKSGPVASYPTPYDAFTAIWDKDIMDHIAAETNKYAQECATVMFKMGTLCPNSRIAQWRDTNIDELYVFMAIILATGVVVKSSLDEYWNKENNVFSTPGFSAFMTFERFALLKKCLHFQDNSTFNPEMNLPEAKLHKLRPIIDHLNNKFSTLYVLGQNVALDESLTQWKGKLSINQFISNKAATVGVKTYEVCDSRNGYLWRFEIHTGKEPAIQDATPISGKIPSLVLNLLEGLEGQGRTIWMDNYYNSPALARELKSRGFDCVGTIRTNRQFVPTQIEQIKKEQMLPGQIVGCTSGDVDLMVWRDRNRVGLISTYHGLSIWEGHGETLPAAVHDYNMYMGGVDRKDQMLAMYPIERKRTKIWYKKMFKRLLNVSVLNAYILYKHSHPAISHRDFRKVLTRQLLQHSPPKPKLPSESRWNHFPAQYTFNNSSNAKKLEKMRRQCKECKKRTQTYCEGCNVTLCLFECFKKYHEKPYAHKNTQPKIQIHDTILSYASIP